jgi:flagellar biosynthetic protein FliR
MDVMHPAIADVHVFLLVFVRITAMVALLPIFGSQNVPVQMKAGFSIVLAIIFVPFVNVEAIAVPSSMLGFVVLLIKELFVGITIGFAASFLFVALQFAGRLVDRQMGFAMVQLIDPFTDAPTTTLGQLKILVFTILFLMLNGHYFMILAIETSFDKIPLLGASFPSGHLAYVLNSMVAGIFVSAMKLAAPVFVTLVLTSIALGVVARTVPQMNVFFVGLPLKISVGFGTTVLVLPMLAELFRRMVEALVGDIWKILYLMA